MSICHKATNFDQLYESRNPNLDPSEIEAIFKDKYDDLPEQVWDVLRWSLTYNNISQLIKEYPEYDRELSTELIWGKLYAKDYGPMYNEEEKYMRNKGDRNPAYDGMKNAYKHRRMLYRHRLQHQPTLTTNADGELLGP